MIEYVQFVVTNTYKAFKTLFFDIRRFFKELVEPLTFPWAAAHMALLYCEVTTFYLDKCKAIGVPFMEPDTTDMVYVTTHIKEVPFYNDIKEKVAYDLSAKIKLILVPYSVAAPYIQQLKSLQDSATKHNEQFSDIETTEMENKMLESLDLYHSVFGLPSVPK